MSWKSKVRAGVGDQAFSLLQRLQNDLRARRAGSSLISLATHFQTDKWNTHWYAKHYETHLARFKDRPITLLEIGIGGYDDPKDGGASLRAWKWYFRRGSIAGIDIYDKHLLEEDRIRTFQGSQEDPDFLKGVIEAIGTPDIIIDDGSHLNHHVLRTFALLFPILAENGVYVVEDTQTSYWPTWGGEVAIEGSASTTCGFFGRLTHCMNHSEYLIPGYQPSYYDRHVVGMHFYHNIVFLEKGNNDEKSNVIVNGALPADG